MVFRFSARAGRLFVERGDYSLANGEGDVVRTSSWHSVARAGAALLMAAIIRISTEPPATPPSLEVCPRCQRVNDINLAINGTLRWCGWLDCISPMG